MWGMQRDGSASLPVVSVEEGEEVDGMMEVTYPDEEMWISWGVSLSRRRMEWIIWIGDGGGRGGVVSIV